jgi:hypothetical protein
LAGTPQDPYILDQSPAPLSAYACHLEFEREMELHAHSKKVS